MSRTIKISGYDFIIDDQDYDLVMQYKWSADAAKFPRVYARTTGGRIYLHRLLLGVTDSKIQVDHKNGNTLDNTRANIRICEKGAQNAINRPKQKNNTTGYKGVFLRKERYYKEPVYRAAIRVEQKLLHLGHFKEPKDAAKAYNEAAKKYFGEFAYLNPIEE